MPRNVKNQGRPQNHNEPKNELQNEPKSQNVTEPTSQNVTERTSQNEPQSQNGSRSHNQAQSRNRPQSDKERIMEVTKNFEPREMLAFSQLRTLNQKELIQSLDQNDKLGIVIKDKLQVAMISMEKFENLVEAVHEYGRLLEWLEEQELFNRIEHRLKEPVFEELPEGTSLWEWAGLDVKG